VTDPAPIHLDRDARAALLAVADPGELHEVSRRCIDLVGEPITALPPETGLVMLQVREPVQAERFHLGEVVVSRAEVEWPDAGGAIGWAMRLGTDRVAALAAAVCDGAAEIDLDAAVEVDRLCREVEVRRERALVAEWAELLATRVAFEELD
jgi:alpha-D-ribose 1-methylphosphonate 5-triphosphate synthase subunit PhnG